uniref:Uncharacterized protein n=1 Tax=Podoviridae sp. ctz6O13 TaxID=2827757 RepID=A0A8S5TL08_9CAUD|nr:MAG TPA: hypothetical protein [Podoviridae sp. ctz6O13]
MCAVSSTRRVFIVVTPGCLLRYYRCFFFCPVCFHILLRSLLCGCKNYKLGVKDRVLFCFTYVFLS